LRLHSIISESTTQIPLDRFEHLLTPAVIALNQAAQSAGYQVRIVGGAVRDLLLGKNPKDIDMATDAHPQEMIKILAAAGIRHEPTGLQHGTITAILDGEPIEITTLRIDTNQDGRHADVYFGDGCLDKDLLQKFIDRGYNPDQDYDTGELLRVVQRITR